MRSITSILATLVVLATGGYAATQSPLEIAEASYPKCALVCMAEFVPASSCGLDVACLCTNVPLQANITTCVLESCTIYEGLMTKNVTLTMCGAEVRDDTSTPLLVGVIGGSIALVVFGLRICSGLPSGSRILGWDDWTIAITVLLATPPTVFSVLLSKNGLGKDMWTLPLQNIENVLFYYYLGEIFYFAALSMNKISLLIFILRVFPDKTFRNMTYGVIGLCIAYGASFIFATAFQCSPVDYSWLQVDSHVKGQCNNIHLQSWMSAICNIVIDLIILALPLKNLYALQINLKKKLMIMFMFSLGIFVTIISVIRLRSLIMFANSDNITWDYSDAAWWSTVELHVGIICACLPSLRSLFVSLGATILGSTNKSRATNNATGSGTLGNSRGGTLQAEKQGQNVPRRGDEGDFIPLVDVHDSKTSNKKFGVAVSETDSYDSDGRNFHAL